MQDVRNAVGKLVCRADGKSHRVEIVRKGSLLLSRSDATSPYA